MIKRTAYFCGLDIGVHGVKASLVHARDKQNLDLLGVFEARSTGFKDASVSDLSELADCVSRAVNSVCRKCAVKVQAVHLGISSECVDARRSSAVVPLIDAGTKVISRGDINKVDHQARLLGTGLEEEIIHDFPQMYKVDDVNAAVNPTGLYGRKLESSLLLLLANSNRLRNVVKSVHQAGLEVAQVSLSSVAASGVAFDADLKNQGCVLVDIGAGMTSVLFFKDGVLGDIQFVPWGGQYLTQSLAERLGLAVDLAEDIKKTHAVAFAHAAKEAAAVSGGEILIKREKDYLPIRRAAVCEAVNWEVENLLTHLETVVKGSPLFHGINKGVVMVGGASLLPGLMERIETRLNMPVTMGAAKGLNNAALFAGAIGLAQMSYVKKARERIDLKTPGDLKNKVVERVRELCQEYF
ncbi:MAG: cell division protein FtsA [Candidatus Omnitrophica bacterium]|nr:cell division protein FtsA [Candidatus Omnitrophota bacterium]